MSPGRGGRRRLFGPFTEEQVSGFLAGQSRRLVVRANSKRATINGWFNRQADYEGGDQESAKVVVKRTDGGGVGVWINGRYGAGMGRGMELGYGAVAFAFRQQAASVDNVTIEGTLDMKWFNERTRNVRR